MLWSLIGTLITGTIIGFGGRLVLPGAQDIGLVKTVGVGVVAAIIVGLILSGAGAIVSIVVGSLVAAGLLWFLINRGILKPTTA